jgi:hypothetical protein
MPVVIQVTRNANTNAGALAIGQFGFHDVDPWGLWIGSAAGNKEIAMKAYVNAVVQGIKPLQTACVAMTTGVLPACTYANGTAGLGATLTGNADGALPAQDGVTLEAAERLLVKNQAAPAQNGVYVVTAVGGASDEFVLTRATDMDTTLEIAHVFAFVSGGTTGAATGWVCTSEPELTTVGTDPITFGQFSAAGLIEAGTGLGKSGNVISVNAALGRLSTVGQSAGDSEFLVGTASAGVLAWESGATVRTSLGLTDGAIRVDKLDATAAPVAATDDITLGYTVGSLWIDVTADKAYVCLDNTNGAAVWTETTQTGSAGANAALSNLANVAINTALLDDAAAADDIGSASLPWKDIWLAGSGANAATINFRITGTPTTVSKVITIPDLTGTVLLDSSTIDGGTWSA